MAWEMIRCYFKNDVEVVFNQERYQCQISPMDDTAQHAARPAMSPLSRRVFVVLLMRMPNRLGDTDN